LLTALLAQCANAKDVIGLPFGDELSAITVNAVGTGANGFTTFIASGTTVDPDFPFTITFIEKGNDIIIPTATFERAVNEGKFETFVLYESCAVGRGGVAKCLVSEKIAFEGTTLASAVTTSATITAYTLNARPSGGNTPSQTGLPSLPRSTSEPDASDLVTGLPTTSATIPSDTGAASKLETHVGLAIVLSSLLMFL